METNNKEYWITFFNDAGIEHPEAEEYAGKFVANRIRTTVSSDLNESNLAMMGITIVGDVLLILKHIKKTLKETSSSMMKVSYEAKLSENDIANKTIDFTKLDSVISNQLTGSNARLQKDMYVS